MTQELIKRNKDGSITKIVGEPPKYQPAELQVAIDKYFDKCAQEDKRPTVTALAYDLGFAERASVYNYQKRNKNQESAHIMKRAVLVCQMYLDSQLLNPKVSSAGVIFALKQHGWKDKTEIEHSVGNIDNLKRTTENVKKIEGY